MFRIYTDLLSCPWWIHAQNPLPGGLALMAFNLLYSRYGDVYDEFHE